MQHQFFIGAALTMLGLSTNWRFGDGTEWPNFLTGALFGGGIAVMIMAGV